MLSHILDWLILAGTVGLVTRLYYSGLHRRYRAFYYYMIFYALQTGFFMTLDVRSPLYQQAYIITEPIQWIFYLWMVLEVYSLVLENYRALAKVGRWALVAAVLLAALTSAVSLIAPSRVWQTRLMAYYHVTDRAIYLSLVVFLLTILFVLLQYPITLSRNTIVHCGIFFLYFLCNTVAFLLLTTRAYRGSPIMPYIRYGVMVISLAAIGAWIALLNPEGERRQAVFRPTWMPGTDAALSGHLDHLNAALLRAARK
jgi:hypothetical protein